jgi:hypothetical protein
MVASMANALPHISGVMYWRHDALTALAASNVTSPSGQPWGWEHSLTAANLLRITPPVVGTV